MNDIHNQPCLISIIMQEQGVSGVRGGRYSNGTRHKGNKAKGKANGRGGSVGKRRKYIIRIIIIPLLTFWRLEQSFCPFFVCMTGLSLFTEYYSDKMHSYWNERLSLVRLDLMFWASCTLTFYIKATEFSRTAKRYTKTNNQNARKVRNEWLRLRWLKRNSERAIACYAFVRDICKSYWYALRSCFW